MSIARIRTRLAGAFAVAAAFFLALPAGAEPVVIAQVTHLSGARGAEGRAYSTGMQLYFDALNREGGINGNHVVFVRRNDAGVPSETVRHTREMLRNARPLLLTGYSGAENVRELVSSGLLQEEGIALVGYRAAGASPANGLLFGVHAKSPAQRAQLATRPNPYALRAAVAKEFRQAVAGGFDLEAPVGYAMFEGFVTAKVIAEALRRQDGQPTRTATLEVLEKLSVDVGGFVMAVEPAGKPAARALQMSQAGGTAARP